MTKRNKSMGNGTRYDQIDAQEDKASAQSVSDGFFIPYICPICGKSRGRSRDHSKCSRILQQQRRMQEKKL